MSAPHWRWLLAWMPALTGCSALHSESGRTDWQPLFTGTDLTGWEVKCVPADAGRSFWRVDDGTILADSMDCKEHDYVWLCTTREYSDFVLRLKFQAYRDSPGNSGIQIRSHYDEEAGYLDGPQVNIHPPGPWRTGMIWDETRGNRRWLYPDVGRGNWVDPSMAVAGLTFVYTDEGNGWNDLEISAVGCRMRAVLNGVEVMNYDGTGILDDAIHRERKVGTRGVIALQIHKNDQLRIRFKDVFLKDLTDRQQ